jgi:hypothetical protein
MSNNPEERNRDSRKTDEQGLTQAQPEPIDKQDPTNPVQVGTNKGTAKAKASADVGGGDAAATGAAGL